MRILGIHVNLALVFVAVIVVAGWLVTTAPVALMLVAAILVLACPLVMLWLMRSLRHVSAGRSAQESDRLDGKGARYRAVGDTDVGQGYRIAVLERRQEELERRLTELPGRGERYPHRT